MKIIEFVAELHGNKEVSLNGEPLSTGEPHMEEKIVFNQLTLDQQWQLLAMMRKLLNKMEYTYQKGRVRAHEISMADFDSNSHRRKISSGAAGVSGTAIGKL